MSTVAESKKTNSIDMLHGPLAKKIVLFSIPLAITSILQQLLNSTDAVFAASGWAVMRWLLLVALLQLSVCLSRCSLGCRLA
ncbi:MAG: hypothetical protein KHY80_04985 [Eggerthella sp.]|nr:hypothetical protein [Eggerthella sp.]